MTFPTAALDCLEPRAFMPPEHAIGSVASIRPVFLSGVYRSGTTFLAGLINSHPDYRATSSTVKFLRFCFGRFDPIEQPERQTALVEETRQRLKVRWNLDFDATAALRQFRDGPPTYARMYDAIMRQTLLPNAAPGVQWAEKLASQWSDAPLFLKMFPQGKIVHIFRDPRDVCASYKHLTNEPGFAYLDSAFNCLSAMTMLPEMRDRYGKDRVHLLRAEDLSIDREATIASLCDFLEVDYSAQMLEPRKDLPGERWDVNTSFDGSLGAFAQPASRWAKHLEQAEVAFVEMVCQPIMSRYGYVGSGIHQDRSIATAIAEFVSDPFIATRYDRFIRLGLGSEGYRTDPYGTEMRIVFPGRTDYQ